MTAPLASKLAIGLLAVLGLTFSIGNPAGAHVADYEVKSGDTLSEIARDHGVSTADLADANGIDDGDFIRSGEVLSIPEGGSSATSSSLPSVDLSSYPDLPQSIVDDPERRAMVPMFVYWAEANGLPADLVMAVAWQESGWQTDVISSVGAVGVGQIMPATSPWIAEDLIGQPDLDPYDAEDNIRMSARFIRWLIAYNGTEDLALAGYYQGPGSVASGVLYESTFDYVANVQALRRHFVSS